MKLHNCETFLNFAKIVLLFLLISCRDEKSKKNYLSTVNVCDHLYVENYSIYKGGVQGGDIHSNYLTDSNNFRIFIGTYDDSRVFNYECRNDSIIVNTISRIIADNNRTLSKKYYSLSKLKSSKKFE